MNFRKYRPGFLRFVVACLGLALTGCASNAPQSAGPELDYKSRAISSSQGGVKVSTSVLSAEESSEVYGVELANHGIQPVWIKVENQDDRAYWLMSVGMDPNFFPPSEAAEVFTSQGNQDQLELTFKRLAFRNPVPSKGNVSGFVLTNRDEGIKMVQVDLVSSGRLKSFSFLTGVPGFRADYNARQVFQRDLNQQEEIVNYEDTNAFRKALEQLPCCVTNKKGTRNADPLNLVIVGGLRDAFPALARRWTSGSDPGIRDRAGARAAGRGAGAGLGAALRGSR